MSIDYTKFENEEGVEASNWLLSLIDFIGVMMAFFILMYSFTENSGGKRSQSDTLSDSTPVVGASGESGPGKTMPLNDYIPERSAAGYLQQLLKDRLDAKNVEGFSVNIIGKSIYIHFTKAEVEAPNSKFLTSLALIASGLQNQMEITSFNKDEAARQSLTKKLSTSLRNNGYISRIFEFYSEDFQNISNAVAVNDNTMAVVLRPYEAIE